MKAGIFAAGTGSRFAKAGWKVPKPLIPLQGTPLLGHVLQRLVRAGIEEVEVLLNEEPFSDPVEDYIRRLPRDFRVSIWRKTTTSSCESFFFLMERLGEPPFLLSTVDTIFPEDALEAFLQVRSYPRGCQVALAVTDFVHDEKPLWVDMGPEGKVLALGEGARSRECVTAGLYLILQDLAGHAGEGPFSALRHFLEDLVKGGAEVRARAFPTVLDIDCPDDIRVAEEMLQKGQVGTLV